MSDIIKKYNWLYRTNHQTETEGNSENEKENHPEEEEHLQDESTANAKTGDASNVRTWITIVIFSMLVFGCGIKYKKGNK